MGVAEERHGRTIAGGTARFTCHTVSSLLSVTLRHDCVPYALLACNISTFDLGVRDGSTCIMTC
jgi:hypothetical protein